MDVISLTKKLLSFNTINPPGNEAEIACFTGSILTENGFDVRFHEFGENRLHLIAEKGVGASGFPAVLSGHLDTVPEGKKPWTRDLFSGYVNDGKIWGRGSSDMKGGLAAMIVASIEAFRNGTPGKGVRLIFTAGEELGCQGISQLAADRLIPADASGIIVGEPTGNIPAVGHKGALYLNAVATGKTAHSSMPEKGDNAIYKVAEAIMRLKDIDFGAEEDRLLGFPTINIGKISGGMNINSVPDRAEFTIDVRTTSKSDHGKILKQIKEAAGREISIEKLVDTGPVSTSMSDPFARMVFRVMNVVEYSPTSLPYLTDGAVLQKVCNAPVIILGPGEPGQAHQTDEFCYVSKIEEAVEIYRNILIMY
ncbi:MAG TPA: M20 family metallopeptidase [Bacteroidales bacterium]|nr:M20 family metallopeptidase [Bacteroidales bacterium]